MLNGLLVLIYIVGIFCVFWYAEKEITGPEGAVVPLLAISWPVFVPVYLYFMFNEWKNDYKSRKELLAEIEDLKKEVKRARVWRGYEKRMNGYTEAALKSLSLTDTVHNKAEMIREQELKDMGLL